MSEPTCTVAVIYYSSTGNVAAMAEALGAGAAAAGAEVRVRRVPELAPPEAIAYNPKWAEFVEKSADEPVATLDDIAWADAIAIGSPTRFGGPASQMKAFLDTTGGLWAKGVLVDKVGTAFTSCSTAHGGLESTILAINNHFYHWGSIVLPLGYENEHLLKVSGNPYGASFVSRKGAAPDEDALTAARMQGERLARVTSWIRAGKQAQA
jgi:NAD(P)H dehydrogenase (quinone)